jgi:nucleoside-diphosphate-sugar epimerase
MKRLLLTGATGFIGRNLCSLLPGLGYIVRVAARSAGMAPDGTAEVAVVGDLSPRIDWREALAGIDTVIHAAARVHHLDDRAGDEPYLEVNARGTQCLAQAAVHAGVGRFIYLSSVKVNGEGRSDRPYSASDEPQPHDAYARSKWQGERSLHEAAAASTMQAVVVRAPLVYGPGVKGNFLRLLRWVRDGRPLPLGGIDNRRSLVSVWNLCDLLRLLAEHPSAPGTWMVSDGEDLSTPELVRRMASAMGRQARLFPLPGALLATAARLGGRGGDFGRLSGSLTVDIAATRRGLGWSPPLSVTEGIARTVAWYRASEQPNGT